MCFCLCAQEQEHIRTCLLNLLFDVVDDVVVVANECEQQQQHEIGCSTHTHTHRHQRLTVASSVSNARETRMNLSVCVCVYPQIHLSWTLSAFHTRSSKIIEFSKCENAI